MMNTKEIPPEKLLEWKIRHYQKLTIPPSRTAELLGVSVEKVCDVLGYTIENMEDQHRDYCFLNHGIGDLTDYTMEYYSLYMQEGDFEKWQPVCYMNRNCFEFQKLKKEAELIPESKDPREEARRLWILNRFTEFQSEEWSKIRDAFHEQYSKIPGGPEITAMINDIRLENRKIEDLFK